MRTRPTRWKVPSVLTTEAVSRFNSTTRESHGGESRFQELRHYQQLLQAGTREHVAQRAEGPTECGTARENSVNSSYGTDIGASEEKIVDGQLIWGSVPAIELAECEQFSVMQVFRTVLGTELFDDDVGFPEE